MIVVLNDPEYAGQRGVLTSPRGSALKKRLPSMQTFRFFQRVLTTFQRRKSPVKFVPACQDPRSPRRGLFTTSPSSALGLLALAMLAMPSRALAQAGTTGAISGILADSQGGVVPQAE